MKLRVVVDANIFISALLGGKPRFILFDSKFKFLTTEATIKEVEKYIPLISEKSGVAEQEIKEGISLLPIQIFPRDYYEKHLGEAEGLIGEIDPDDIDILALYLKEKTFLWSEDKDFEKISQKVNLLKTEDLI